LVFWGGGVVRLGVGANQLSQLDRVFFFFNKSNRLRPLLYYSFSAFFWEPVRPRIAGEKKREKKRKKKEKKKEKKNFKV